MKPDRVILRTAGLEDAFMLYEWECSCEARDVTLSEQELTLDFVCSHVLSSQNLVRDLQQRWVVEDSDHSPIGTLDMYDYDPSRAVARVGIYIVSEARGSGYATEALRMGIEKARGYGVRRLLAEVHAENVASLSLFGRVGFETLESNGSQSIVRMSLEL
ncbi:MAG: GNAT family N-acetyltransferase [Rikenellaceae bacterium]|nr:GNAT family N-acetyltransferase [Rikenellaceae bacterium]